MTQQSINKKILYQGVRYMLFTLPLMFLGPIIIHSSLKNQAHLFFYPVLGLGIIMCALSMYLLFKGLTTIVKSLFGN